MAVWQADFTIVPNKENFIDSKEQTVNELAWSNIKDIESAVENVAHVLSEKKSWSNDIRQYGKIDSTCLELLYDENIIEIRCRFDLRSLSRMEFETLIKFVSNIGGAFQHQNQRIDADYEKMLQFLKQSEEARYCVNPEAFLRNISTQNN